MASNEIHLAGTGCCLMDYLYTKIDFEHPAFRTAISRNTGDGGLRPGALVFAEDFERFIGKPFPAWLETLTQGKPPDAENLGGPAIISLIHVAQMLVDQPLRISFHAASGNDATGQRMREMIGRAPIDQTGYQTQDGSSPSTVVLSDPGYHSGKGERTFINTVGTAGAYTPDMLGDDFFEADVCLFGATALLPQLHDHLTDLLRRVKKNGGVTVVGTVYDFRNEQRSPGQPWPLGAKAESYPLIDLLVCDYEEALKISGCHDVDPAIRHFIEGGVGAVIVTHGAKGFHLAAQDGLFTAQAIQSLPVCRAVDADLDRVGRHVGDTTGCGDNFLGGALSSIAQQMLDGKRERLDLLDACAWGAASGGFACFYAGGLFQESAPGAKRSRVMPYVQAYQRDVLNRRTE